MTLLFFFIIFFSKNLSASQSFHPDVVGFCENRVKKEVNKNLVVNESRDTYSPDILKISEGKFQHFFKIISLEDFLKISSVPDFFKRDVKEKSLLIFSKAVYLLDKKHREFFLDKFQLSSEFILKSCHEMKVISPRKEGLAQIRVRKKIKINALYTSLTTEALMSSMTYSSQEESWAGYPADETFKGEVLKWGQKIIPRGTLLDYILVLTMDHSTDILHEVRSINFIYLTEQKKHLVLSFQIIVTKKTNMIVEYILKKMSGVVGKNLQREIGRMIDVSRMSFSS